MEIYINVKKENIILPSPVSFNKTNINGVYEVLRAQKIDNRGFFMKILDLRNFTEWGNRHVEQINFTYTKERGTVRGLHFQVSPNEEAKLVTCICGRVTDIVLDLRKGSSTFGDFAIVELNSESQNSILIPEGCAHGLQTMTDNVKMLYAHSAPYVKSDERTIYPLDPDLAIEWPMPIQSISDKDKNGQSFRNFKLK